MAFLAKGQQNAGLVAANTLSRYCCHGFSIASICSGYFFLTIGREFYFDRLYTRGALIHMDSYESQITSISSGDGVRTACGSLLDTVPPTSGAIPHESK
jgi:hypothetical protein